MGLLGSTWVYLGLFGSSWVYLGQLGSSWVYLGQLGSTSVNLGLLGSSWVFLGLLQSTLVYLGLLGSSCVYLVLLSLFQITIEWLRTLRPISGRLDGRTDSLKASLLRAPYGANNHCLGSFLHASFQRLSRRHLICLPTGWLLLLTTPLADISDVVCSGVFIILFSLRKPTCIYIQYIILFECFFRHARVSSTYPCMSVRW